VARRSWLALALLTLAVAPLAGHAGDKAPAGAVLSIGGGTLTDAIVDRLVELAHGQRLVVCPAASETVEGPEVARFRERGAKDVVVADFRTRAEADDPARLAALEHAGGIFFTGGDQKRLLETLQGSKALAALVSAHEAGAVVAGTSAGCAVLGELAILGDGEPDAIRAGSTPVTAGFNLCPGAILDQHFLARRRHNRLVSALLGNAGKIGVGVDERTAVVWRGSALEVLGDGYVSVYLPGKDRTFTLRLLASGERFTLPGH
jgi:cyanophycinase